MNAFREVNYRRMAVVGTLAAAALALPPAVSTAYADDWQQCVTRQPDQVLAACSAVIDQGGRDGVELSRAYAIRGEWHRMRRQNDEALADFHEAEKLDPKSYAAIAGLGATLEQKGQLADALANEERAIALNPQNPYGYLVRGVVHQRQNQLTEAMADFDHAISLRGDVPIYYVRRGALLNQTGEPDRALADLDHAIALNPDLA